MTAILLFLATFGFYLSTLSGTIPAYRDSGDLICAITTLGIAHPPGYPLYVLLGKLFLELVPFANAAYRVNVFSAAAAAGTVSLLYRCLTQRNNVELRWDRAKSVCFVASILFALTPAVSNLSRVSEMYALSSLFAVGILTCYIRNNEQTLLLGSFILGCGFGVQPTLLFLAPLLIARKWEPNLKRAGCFLLGFSVILFLLVRSKSDPLQNWGNPSTWSALWQIITRSNYGGFKLHPVESQFAWTLSGTLQQITYFLGNVMRQWGAIGCLVGGVGLFLSLRSDKRLVIVWLIAGPLFFLLSNLPIEEKTTAPILEPYLLLVNIIWALWVAQGLGMMFQRIKPAAGQALILVVLLGSSLFAWNGTFQSFRNHFYAYDLGRNMLRTLPPKAVMFDPDDPISFTLRTLQLQEHRREDIVLLNFFRTRWGYEQIARRWPDLLPPSADPQSAQELEQLFWRYSINHRSFYADLPMKISPPMTYQMAGILYAFSRARENSTADLKRAELLNAFYIWRGTWRTTAHPDFFTQQIFNYRAAAYCNVGLKYAEIKDWETARKRYEQALGIDPHLSPAYNDLGVAAFKQRRYVQAADYYRWAIRYDPKAAGYQQNLELTEQALRQSPK